VRVFKTRWFTRYARQERIDDRSLCDAVARAERGLVDADLGSGIIKQRVPRTGQGRSGGYRVLLVYRSGNMAVFLYGFAKNERENIADDDLKTLREIGAAWLKAKDKTLEQAIEKGILKEMTYEDQKQEN
jgi:hypothetical protein